MAQPSVASYFTTRKRNAIDEIKQTRSHKVLHQENPISDNDEAPKAGADRVILKPKTLPIDTTSLTAKIVQLASDNGKAKAKKVTRVTKTKKTKEDDQNIQELFNKIVNKEAAKQDETTIAPLVDPVELHKTPPSTPTKQNAMDKIKPSGKELNIKEIRQKLTRSHRLAELKASIARFKENDLKLQEIKKKTAAIPDSPGLKAFKSIELEVHLSPQKLISPEKAYLSPRKDSTAKRNLLTLLSPSKNPLASPRKEQKLLTLEKLALTLPYKYKTLAEMFRSIDTVCQIMHNRQETITYKKLKPAVEELIKRNLTERHLAQILHLFPNAFSFRQEKLRGYGTKQESWELIIAPQVENTALTADILLERRRQFFKLLIDKVKVYHQEFLQSLEPPMVIDADKITRWHPEFDIERVPDIEMATLPQAPQEEKLATGKDVLERAKIMFNCNSRMEAALERLKKSQAAGEKAPEPVEKAKEVPPSILKGIPKSLLEKIRQKQAAKALESMTRTDVKEKEIQMYSQLPELARLTRNVFVVEKRSVLHIDIVLEKLDNSRRNFMPKTDIELQLKAIEKEVPGWLMFHTIRSETYVKISKDADLNVVQGRLDKVLKQKMAA